MTDHHTDEHEPLYSGQMLVNQDDLFSASDVQQRGLTGAEREARRQRAVCGVFQKTNRILLGTLEVDVAPKHDPALPPGWTTGREIYLNFHHLPGKTDRELIALWGLNYHELAHIILTPRIKQELRKLVRDRYFGTGLNIAEDWRIETQFAALFTDAERYFQISFADLVVHRKDQVESDIYALAAGRLYLSAASRERWRRLFAAARVGVAVRDHMPTELLNGIASKHPDLLDLTGEEWANALRDVAEEYAVLAWARTGDDARTRNRHLVWLAERTAILALTPSSSQGEDWVPEGAPGEGSAGGDGIYQRDLPAQGAMDEKFGEVAAEASLEILARSREEQARVDEALRDAGLDGSVTPAPAPSAGAEADGPNPGKAKRDKSKVVVNPSQGIVSGGTASAATASGGLSGGAGINTAWEGAAARTAQLSEEQRLLVSRVFADTSMHDELLTAEIDDLSQSRQVQRNLTSTRRAVADALGEGMSLSGQDSTVREDAPDKVRGERNRLARYLREVRSQLEGTYVGDQSAGKVHVRSWINATPAQKPHSFRAWLPDEVDEMGLEVVGLLDRSSSMSGCIDHASQVLWSVASAVQQTEGKVTLVGFADPGKEEVLLGRDSVLHASKYDSYGTYGGTHAAEALKIARQVLAASDQPNRLLYIVTDGGWGDTQEAIAEIRKINADGVDTLLVLLGMHLQREHRGCKYVVQADDVQDMGRALTKIVRRISTNAARRVAIERGVIT